MHVRSPVMAVEGKLTGLSLLLVEDDADSRELLTEFMRETGAACTEASSGNDAFEAFRKTRPDVLISDLWMPDGDGFELMRRIRALPPDEGGLVPAIAVSAASNSDDAIMAGYHMLIAKPYDPLQVVDAVAEFTRPGEASPTPPWALALPDQDTVLVTLTGRLRAGDVPACAEALAKHLASRPANVVVDMRGLTSLSFAAVSVAQRVLWPHRASVRQVRIVGGPRAARLVAVAACRVLGIAATLEDGRS